MAKKEKSEAKIPETKIVPFESTQKCVLTDKELQAMGAQLADAIDEGKRLEADFAELKQQFKGKIDGAAGRASGLSSTIRAKSEYRSVKCERVFDFKNSKVTEYRIDTDEIIGERLMTDSDRQQHLPLEERQVPFAQPSGGKPYIKRASAGLDDEQLLEDAEAAKPESEFVASVRAQFDDRGTITDSQRDALRKIVDE